MDGKIYLTNLKSYRYRHSRIEKSAKQVQEKCANRLGRNPQTLTRGRATRAPALVAPTLPNPPICSKNKCNPWGNFPTIRLYGWATDWFSQGNCLGKRRFLVPAVLQSVAYRLVCVSSSFSKQKVSERGVQVRILYSSEFSYGVEQSNAELEWCKICCLITSQLKCLVPNPIYRARVSAHNFREYKAMTFREKKLAREPVG